MVKLLRPPAGRGIPLHADSIQFWAERQKQLRRHLPRWNQFRSSLDAIRQTHRAIEAYNHSNGELTDDQRYLAIYGLLQALVVQQDAICHLTEALGTKPVHMNRHKRLEEIRNIRNWTVGHPTKIDRYDTHSHHAIQRPQLGRGGFSLYSAFDDGREQYTYVPLLQLARLQRRVVSRVLRDILKELNSRGQQPARKGSRLKPDYRGATNQRSPSLETLLRNSGETTSGPKRPQRAPHARQFIARHGAGASDGINRESRRHEIHKSHERKKRTQIASKLTGGGNNLHSNLSPHPGEKLARQRPAA